MKKKTTEKRNADLPLVAIDLGSDTVRAMAARRVGDSVFEILGVEQLSSHSAAIEQGLITQTAGTAFVVTKVLQLLANRIGEPKLTSAFVCVGGTTMRSVAIKSKRDLIHRRAIPQSTLDEMERECKEKLENRNPQICVLGVVPSFFVLDGELQEYAPTPDQQATLIEGNYTAFYARKEAETMLQKTFQQTTTTIEQTFVRPDALLSVFAEEDGNQILSEGCAVLDFGAETTTLAVYKCGEYLNTGTRSVVPQGGYHLTRAIEQLGVSFSVAEKLKRDYAYAAPDLLPKDKTIGIRDNATGDIVSLSFSDIASQVETALEGILAPLLEVLHTHEARIRTLYITGGGAMLRGLDTYLARYTSLPVRYGGHDLVVVRNTPEQYLEPTYASLVGTILLGQDYRDKHPNQLIDTPKTILDKGKDLINSLFDGSAY